MKIFVKARPGAREEKIEKLSETQFIISVKEPPKKGRANYAIAAVLAEHFSVPFSRVRLVSGFSSRQKVFDIV
jgi:uncharacterized protein